MNCTACHHSISHDEPAVILGSIGYHRACFRSFLFAGKRAA